MAKSLLLQTIIADLAAGESWFEKEAESVGLALWNTLKGAFIALGPAEMQLLQDVLSAAVVSAGAGKSIEDTFTAALNSAKADEKTILMKAGAGVANTIIAGIRATIPTN